MELNPTGLSESSPQVCRKKLKINHSSDTLSAPPAATTRVAAQYITRKPNAARNTPKPNFVGLERSYPRRDNPTQSAANAGASAITKNGLMSWLQDAGISQPKMFRSVKSR